MRQALVAEDDPAVRRLVATLLGHEGFSVAECGHGRDAVANAREHDVDLIVLDVDMPMLDGVEACRRIRAFSDAYVILLTGKATEFDKLVGFSAGCDDYVTKPFSAAELMARVRALLRRPRMREPATGNGLRRFGDLVIDAPAREVQVGDRTVELTRTEFDLLDALSASPRLAFSRSQLIARVWGEDWFGDDHLVDVHISNLRRKLGDPRFISTVRGVGYRMSAGA
jgi:DNA-binding response OmpR family regulator